MSLPLEGKAFSRFFSLITICHYHNILISKLDSCDLCIFFLYFKIKYSISVPLLCSYPAQRCATIILSPTRIFSEM